MDEHQPHQHKKFTFDFLKVKRIDSFILSKFLQLFVAAFCVCLFVYMMQFTWRYVDDLVGKGLTLDILGRFFWYMGLTLVPQALPLAFLLASLITFGNMGENLELLSMKAAGIPLLRVMRPLILFAVLMSGVSFHFQNSTSPEAWRNLRQLIISMRESQPAVEIPEGIFYNGVPKVNLYVEKKNARTGMLYQVIIYKTDQGFDKAQIVIADSGRLSMTADKLHLRLELWNGHQFQSLEQGQSRNIRATSPYDRETFLHKELLIDFDSNFSLSENESLQNMPAAKSMKQIVHDVDSMNARLDSVALEYVSVVGARRMARGGILSKADTLRLEKLFKAKPVNIDSVFVRHKEMMRTKGAANSAVKQMVYDLTWKDEVNENEEYYIRRHWIEWHTKITLSLACILFFFIGAPLGAIIRKGGLGTPAVISVGIFIFYYIINTSGMKMAREGSISMVLGMWVSTAILLPAGCYLTYMSNRDSQVFNIDAYKAVFRKVFGIRVKRNMVLKEVILHDPDYPAALLEVRLLREVLGSMKVSPLMAVNYLRYRRSKSLNDFIERLEALIEDLANTRDLYILQALNNIPNVSKRHLFSDKRKMLRAFEALELHIAKYVAEDEPEIPEIPDLPDLPDTPDLPGIPDNPDIPDLPGNTPIP